MTRLFVTCALALALVGSSFAAERIVLGSQPFGCFPTDGAELVETFLAFDGMWNRVVIVAIVKDGGREGAWTYMLPMSVYYAPRGDHLVQFEDRDMTIYTLGAAVPAKPGAQVVRIRSNDSVQIHFAGFKCTLSFDPVACGRPATEKCQETFRRLHGER